MVSHKLLVRAGYVRQLGSGIYTLLPLGSACSSGSSRSSARRWTPSAGRRWRCRWSIPPSCGRRAGRYAKIGPELVRFKDRGGRDMVLAMTHEEVVADLLRDLVKSYRQLPADRLPLPDQVPRRATRARRPDPGPRVRDEGLLHARRRRGRAGRLLPAPLRAPTEDLRAAGPARRWWSGPMSGSWAAAWPTSSWSSTSTARTPSSCARRVRLRGEPADRARRRKPEPAPRSRSPPRRWPRRRRRHHRVAGRAAGRGRPTAPPRPSSS